ncbi:MAG: 1-(5-phosphoribosyl)-5-[(5-phosphoribosylamino)methylideneamino]imidazole-4-carboxamide isomerase [Kiritimatiellae bacterium]|nr:1-(5-phosphoribosyl)-5-[(5-phosphoribosylamino)methylideneamino]imidazole-4-carboxamide isomerase [Kiritimatiellia bacterium]
MIVIPAIDLKDGRCVRLRQGRLDAVTEFSDDPVGVARRWEEEGACYLHVVDLDGALAGKPVHCRVVAAIVRSVRIPVEVGGGIRSEDDIRRMIDLGADRVVLGTFVCQAPEGLVKLVQEFGPRIAVGIDARDGWVQVRGWTQIMRLRAVDLARMADAAGVRTVIVTDTASDGMLCGVNVSGVAEVCDVVNCGVIASGGVSSVGDIRALRELRRRNLVGVIVGRALYEGVVCLRDLLGVAGESKDDVD